jgi:hypothetical protein
MQWWELALGLGDAYDDFLTAEKFYLRRLDAGGEVAVRALGHARALEAVSCDRAALLPLVRRALRRWPSAQISLRLRRYPVPQPCGDVWEKLYGHPPGGC